MSFLKKSGRIALLWSLSGVAMLACLINFSHRYVPAFAWVALLAAALLVLRYNHSMRSKPVITRITKDEIRESVVFILGPWAKTWFSGALDNDGIRLEKGRAWFLASSPGELTRHLERLKANHPEVIPLGFFPLMPDGHATSELMNTQLVMWKNTFAALNLAEPLPCTFALYTQMTAERPARDPGAAIWSNVFPAANTGQCDIKQGLASALGALAAQRDSNHHAVRRHAMGCTLREWLNETAIQSSLDALFTHPSLRLNGVLLADYGTGFVRHGAWSAWCEKTLALLPGLTASLTTPPLPVPQSVYQTTHITRTTPPGVSRGYKTMVVAFTAAALALIFICYLQAERALSLRHQMQRLVIAEALNDDNQAQLANALEQHQALVDCLPVKPFGWTAFAGCEKLKHDVAVRLHPESFTDSDAPFSVVGQFASSSAALSPEHEARLRALLPQLLANGAAHYLIVGYSDNTGSAEQNRLLSTQRAVAVRNWLVQHSALLPERFVLRGAGTRNPISDNTNKAERAKNRRVEFYTLQ